jgi:hypothetical protein
MDFSSEKSLNAIVDGYVVSGHSDLMTLLFNLSRVDCTPWYFVGQRNCILLDKRIVGQENCFYVHEVQYAVFCNYNQEN